MHRFMPREAVRGEREHSMVVPIGGRTGDVVEPLLQSYWVMNTSIAKWLSWHALL